MNTSTKILLALLMPVLFICNRLQAQNTFPSTGAAEVDLAVQLPESMALHNYCESVYQYIRTPAS